LFRATNQRVVALIPVQHVLAIAAGKLIVEHAAGLGIGATVEKGRINGAALQGGLGADLMDGGAGDDVLDGTFGATGGADADGTDTLIGGDGDDTLKLGAGDEATGGAGADTFTGGDYAEDAAAGTLIRDFDPSEDVIEILYDPEANGDPIVTVEDFADGTGANIVLNGDVILSVSGAQGLDPNAIALRASA
jgi:Ca2+-binding RTX toxin-like protein